MNGDLAATVSQWATETNEAVHIQLVSGESAEGVLRSLDIRTDNGEEEEEPECDGADVIQFHPVFTYQMYGQQERVFGYKGLRINLHYAAGSLATFLNIEYTKRIDQMETSLPIVLKADDIDTPMRKTLSASALCSDKEEFAHRVATDTKEFRPYGKKCHEYVHQDITYEVYDSTFDSEEFCEYHRRMQTFMLFYIEGAQFIDASDEKWRVFTVFEKLVLQGTTSYSLVGYCTMYQFFHYPDRKRPRISQFLVLPPFQGQGHGSQLYRFIYSVVRSTPEYVDLTVEDPSESFDDMRDRNDMRFLLDNNAFDGLTAPVDAQTISQLQTKYKLSRRQMVRCVEIGLLKKLDKAKNPDAYSTYRLFVKRRIYAQNTDQLAELDDTEKKEKVAESFAAVEDDYHRILSLL
ncbi:histone acetyltransferase 1 [Coemansia sp. RSA 1813]|nr:histone acetyltransferase 1 [Coemansia sp. RSA 1843]KAJ2086339.1 histone acetyltransferase 1 [Coemansia sp. RSA 986]KAJ2210990.1 histone acetyltransferase 1 [Coemansia sp. RSA 487]KAJ2564143.1 histone acetyltransferase 1 [Coemansia sp. RSA 1813]